MSFCNIFFVSQPFSLHKMHHTVIVLTLLYHGFTQTPDFGGLKVPFPPLKEERETKSNEKRKKEDKDKPPTEPKYTILHRGEFTMQDFTNDRESTLIKRPKELVVSVELPGVESAAAVDLDIFEKKMALKSETPFYKLDVSYHN